jgi:hypothetical protein
MRRLNSFEDEHWDEAEDDKRVRWFGHPARSPTSRHAILNARYLPSDD